MPCWKPDAGSRTLEAGSWKPEAGSPQPGAGSRRPAAGGWKPLLLLSLLSVIATGCASVQAKAPADRPALMVPPPPPRVVEPAEVPPEPVAEPPATGSSSTATRPSSTPPRPTPPRPAASEAKPEPKPDLPVEQLPPAPAAPPPQLRTPQTADPGSAAKAVRTTIDTAWGILNGVNFGALSSPRKKAYNDAKVFLQQAEDALKTGNLAFAQGVASKAETLAKELAGR